jgi:hypothetical protein
MLEPQAACLPGPGPPMLQAAQRRVSRVGGGDQATLRPGRLHLSICLRLRGLTCSRARDDYGLDNEHPKR